MNPPTNASPRSTHTRLVAALAAAAMALTACTSDDVAKNDIQQEFTADLEIAIEEAKESNASDEQIAALETARDTGEISLEVARTGAHAAAACLTDLGWNADFEENTAADGMVLPAYSVTVPDSEADRDPSPAMEECERKHFYWLNQMYSTQPIAVELSHAHIRERAHVVRPCLAENGFPVDEDASVDELISAQRELSFETEGAIDCMIEAGIGSY